MKEVWTNRSSSVAPTALKRAISDANAMFAGYQQHDSHELLSFLLDAIHEDLNRVIDKPGTEAPEHDGSRDDREVGVEAWETHLKRNQSVVVDHFQGQLRSVARCLWEGCGQISVKFDEYACLSLPLPQPSTKNQQVHLVRGIGDGESPLAQYEFTKRSVQVPIKGTVGDLRDSVAEESGIQRDNLFICEIYQSRVYKELGDGAMLSAILARDNIFAYEIPEGVENGVVQIMQRKPPTYSHNHSPEKFAHPIVFGKPSAGYTNRQIRSRALTLGNAMLRTGELERFSRLQEAADMEAAPALAKALTFRAAATQVSTALSSVSYALSQLVLQKVPTDKLLHVR